jgi:histidine triad (HIT) family protein
MMTTDCIFCRIVAKDAPAHIVHEDERCLVFLDRRPVTPGALMVIPKAHIDQFCDVPDEDAAHILLVAQRISRVIRTELQPRRVGLAVAGFGVPHAHLHIVPMHGDHDVTSGVYASSVDGQVVFRAENAPLADPGQQADMAARLRQGLAR